MAKVLMDMEEFKDIEQLFDRVDYLKKQVRKSTIFDDPASCRIDEKDVTRPFTLEETKALVRIILSL